jgi:hypothetical protein
MMANLFVTEFPSISRDHGTPVPVAFGPAITTQVLSTAGGSVQSNAFNANTTLVRCTTDAGICSVKFGTNPTATTSDMRMAANQTEYFAVQSTGGMKLATINNT